MKNVPRLSQFLDIFFTHRFFITAVGEFTAATWIVHIDSSWIIHKKHKHTILLFFKDFQTQMQHKKENKKPILRKRAPKLQDNGAIRQRNWEREDEQNITMGICLVSKT